MAWRDDRFRDVLAVKGLTDPARIHHRTKLRYPQIGRYTSLRGSRGFGTPSVDTLATLAITLEIDADFLLGSDARYDEMSTVQAAAHMSLDRYASLEARRGKPIPSADLASLRLIASNHSQPPLWAEDWHRHHESLRLRQLEHAAPSSQAQPKPTG
jgi:hypothetical protein